MAGFEEQVAIVTGAATGIGYGIAKRLGRDGARIVMVDIDSSLGEQSASELAAHGVEVMLEVGDVSETEVAERAAKRAIDTWGRVDILINNAGIGGDIGNIWELSVEEMDRVYRTNLRGVFVFCHTVIPHMLERDYGRIVNIASIAGKEGNPRMVPYSTTKAAVIALTKSVGKELARTGVRVNCVTPALVQTRMVDRFSPEQVEYLLERVPMGRTAEIEEIAALVAWLASSECSFSTGAVFDISGGRADILGARHLRERTMSDLYLHNRKVDSVFQLLGDNEDDITSSVAWALARCPTFLTEFVQNLFGYRVNTNYVRIDLQRHESHGGFTDIEIGSPGKFHLIVEAKKGWTLPGRRQLKKYAERKSFEESAAPDKRLIVLSECSREYAELNLEMREIAGVPIETMSWKDVAALARKARPQGLNAEKRLIGQLLSYLARIMTMQNVNSNEVYVVALSGSTRRGWSISWIDIVRSKSRYFHPVGGSYPKEPPNYVGFRYHGKLQSIHHIDNYEIVTNMHERIPEIPETHWEPHFLYTLGPAFGPNKQGVKSRFSHRISFEAA